MSKSLPIACPLMRETCADGVVDVHGFAHYCAFYLDDTCYVFDALKSISGACDSFNQVTDNGVQMSIAVAGAVDTYEQN